ncbi:MAG: cysteine-rich small domain-containing protein [Lachnospiraceae bacterium]|nr:cysteine-rich small domain-containing protein [Lachnospiraceae bacterium]
MNNSGKFFANRSCEYYPCHKGIEDINCMFCFCPLYNMDCPGNYIMKEKNGRMIKSCIDCTFPHIRENYDIIMDLLREL